MTSLQQRAELHRQIWQIANEVRGSIDGWDFKQYVLGALFYRFISEQFCDYVKGEDEEIDYTQMSDEAIDSIEDFKKTATIEKGYFIYPSQLFANVVRNADSNNDLNSDLNAIFKAIEGSATGCPSEDDIKGLFSDFDTTSSRLGNNLKERNNRLKAVLKGVATLDFGSFMEHKIDLFGDAYEFLISNYAANAGKSGGEFFTPQSVSNLLAKLAIDGQDHINKVYDPACGSGSLLLCVQRQFKDHFIEEGFFGQEINYTTYNLARMNMFLHDVSYEKFDIKLGDTIASSMQSEDDFNKVSFGADVIVSNPPYSVNWAGSEDPTLINEDRFAPAGVLAPKSKADFAFVLHSLYHLSAKGRAAIVCFPGIFYRGGAEQKIRKYLIDNGYVESVIALAPNLFYGTSIAVNILTLSKKTHAKVRFINASELFKKETNNNTLTEEHIERILTLFREESDFPHEAISVGLEAIQQNDYNLSVSAYVQAKDTREAIDIDKLNAEIRESVERIERLRKGIDEIVSKIERIGK